MKECEAIALELPGYVNGKLEAGAAGQVRMHLEFCTACQDEARRLEYLEVLLSRHLPAIEPSRTFASTFANRLAAEIAAEEGRQTASEGVLGWLFRPWAIPVAVTAAAVLGGLLVTPWLSRDPGDNAIVPKVTGPAEVASVAKKPAAPAKPAAKPAADTHVAAASTAEKGAEKGAPVTAETVTADTASPDTATADNAIVAASAPPEDVVERPELFVDFAVIRDLDILDADNNQGSDKTG
jgi:anti-sigma factor RsiW